MFIVDDILDKLKNILKTDSKTKKVFDKELAEALDLTQANFATMKNRGKIPYTNILNFCAKRKISINWLLYNQNPNSLIDSTDRYWIKYYPTVNVSAGGGAYDSEDYCESLELPDCFLTMLGGKENLKNIGTVIYLKSSFDGILKRIKKAPNAKNKLKKRPLLQNKKEAMKLYDTRVKEYERVADIIVDVENRDLEFIVKEILGQIK